MAEEHHSPLEQALLCCCTWACEHRLHFPSETNGLGNCARKKFKNVVNRGKKVNSLEGTSVGRELCKSGAAAEGWA